MESSIEFSVLNFTSQSPDFNPIKKTLGFSGKGDSDPGRAAN